MGVVSVGPGQNRRQGARAAGLAALAAVVLTGCFEGTLDFDINEDQSVHTEAELYDSEGTVSAEEFSCAEIDGIPLDVAGEIEVHEQIEQDGMLGCHVVTTVVGPDMANPDGSPVMSFDDDVVTMSFDGFSDLVASAGADSVPDVVYSVTFPGHVLDPDGGDVSGTTVTFEGDQYATSGFTTSGSMDPATADEPPPEDAVAATEDSNGLAGTWIFVGVGFAIALAAAALLVLASKRSRSRSSESN